MPCAKQGRWLTISRTTLQETNDGRKSMREDFDNCGHKYFLDEERRNSLSKEPFLNDPHVPEPWPGGGLVLEQSRTTDAEHVQVRPLLELFSKLAAP